MGKTENWVGTFRYLEACSFRSWVAWPDGFSECCGSERQDCIKRRVKGEREYGWILIFDICTVGIHSFLGRYLELVWVEIDWYNSGFVVLVYCTLSSVNCEISFSRFLSLDDEEEVPFYEYTINTGSGILDETHASGHVFMCLISRHLRIAPGIHLCWCRSKCTCSDA